MVRLFIRFISQLSSVDSGEDTRTDVPYFILLSTNVEVARLREKTLAQYHSLSSRTVNLPPPPSSVQYINHNTMLAILWAGLLSIDPLTWRKQQETASMGASHLGFTTADQIISPRRWIAKYPIIVNDYCNPEDILDISSNLFEMKGDVNA